MNLIVRENIDRPSHVAFEAHVKELTRIREARAVGKRNFTPFRS